MKTNNFVRAFFGIAVLLGGGILLAQNLGFINNETDAWKFFWGILWASIFVISGISIIIKEKRLSWASALFLTVGASVGLNMFDIISVNVWKIFWPVAIMIVGLSILFDKGFGRKSSKSIESGSDISAIFYGEDAKIDGKYSGGQITVVCGGVELDLRQADIEDESTIEIFTLCGGVEISLPNDVVVDNQVRGIFGGSENKTRPDSSAKKKIIVKGDCVFGGLEIR